MSKIKYLENKLTELENKIEEYDKKIKVLEFINKYPNKITIKTRADFTYTQYYLEYVTKYNKLKEYNLPISFGDNYFIDCDNLIMRNNILTKNTKNYKFDIKDEVLIEIQEQKNETKTQKKSATKKSTTKKSTTKKSTTSNENKKQNIKENK